MTRWDKPVARTKPAPKAERVKVGGAVVGYTKRREEDAPRGGFRNHQRLGEIESLIAHRRGGDFDVSDEAYLRAALPTLLFAMREPGCPLHRSSVLQWVHAHVSALCDHPPEWFDAIEAEFSAYPRPHPRRADGIARDLNVTWEEHETLDFRQIGFVGGTPEVKAEIRRIKDRHRKRVARVEAGAAPHALSKARIGVWEWEGRIVSKATYYRLAAKAARETNSSANARETNSSAIRPVGSGRDGRTGLIRPIRLTAGRKRTPEKERSESLSVVARPPARPARATHSPPPPAVTDSDQLRVPVPATLPSQPADAVQLSILPEPQADAELRAACEDWDHGPMPEAIRVAYLAAKRRRAMRQEDIAQAIEISRPQLANALQRTFNLSSGAIERLKGWLLIPDGELPPRAKADADQPARPHHRRGGKRPPNPALSLFTAIDGSCPQSLRRGSLQETERGSIT